ncbi:MAG: hypothetical protein HY327_04980 [Chloroflexi bacterium]|nr:hypothetical protein [Chloroflexota bacterium]
MRQLTSRGNPDAANASPLRRDALALAIFFALTLGMTNPLVRHLATAVEDKQDALLNTWIIAWVGHALITDPLQLFNANIFYPYANSLAFSETLLPQGLFALPFSIAFDNTILGYNLVLLGSFLLAAYAMYLFVFDLTRARGAGIVAGIIFAFNPYNLGNLAQVQLLSFGWLPLAMLWLRRILNSKFVIHNSFLFALFFALQALSSFYYAFLAGFAVALYLFWFFVPKWLKGKKPNHLITQSLNLSISHSLVSLFFSAALIAIFVAPFFLPYLQVQRELGFERQIQENEPFSASLKLYAEVSPQNLLYGNLLAPRPPIFSGGYPRDNLFLGFIASALALLGIVATRNRARWFYFFLLAFAFVLSLGPRLYLSPTQPTDIILPYRWLYDFIPLLRALRAPVRFDALVMFALAVLAGIGLARIQATIKIKRITKYELRNTNYKLRNTQYAIRMTYLLIPLLALEYLSIPAMHITPIPTGSAIPAYARWLAQQPPTIILELPMLASDPSAPLNLTPQYLSTVHWQKTPDGYSGFNPPRRGEIAYEMKFFPSERAVSLLQAFDVQYVIVHAQQFPDWNTRREQITHALDVQLVQQFGDDYIYRVAPRAMDASALDARLYIPNPVAPNSNFTAFIIVKNRAARSFAIKPAPPPLLSLIRGEERGTEGVRREVFLPLVTSTVSIIPIQLLAPEKPGDYPQQLRVSGQAIGEWNLSAELRVRAGESVRQVVLPARVALSAPLKSEYARGESIAVDLRWLPLNKIDVYYSASVRVVDARGNKIAAQDREPVVSTFLWTPSVPVPDKFTIEIPRDIAPGEYSVQLLMYQAEQGIDALLLDEEFQPREIIVLGKFAVK